MYTRHGTGPQTAGSNIKEGSRAARHRHPHQPHPTLGSDQRNQTFNFAPGRVHRKHSPQNTTTRATQETRTEKKTFPGGLFLPTPISGTQWSAECGEDASELSVNGLALGTVSYLITHPPPGPCPQLPTFRRSAHVIFSEGLLYNLKPYLTNFGRSATLALQMACPGKSGTVLLPDLDSPAPWAPQFLRHWQFYEDWVSRTVDQKTRMDIV